MDLAKRAQQVAPTAIFVMGQKLRELKAQGRDVLAFTAGEPDFPTPAHVLEAAKKAVDLAYHKYPPVAGLPELRSALAGQLKTIHGVDYQPEEVIVTTGAKQALMEALLALVDPGDEVLIPRPCWASYVEQVKLIEGVPVLVDRLPEEGFRLDPERLARKITPRTKALILCHPDNPTGTLVPEVDLQAIAELALRHGFYVISDEIYGRLVYDGAEQVSFAGLSGAVKDLTVTISGFSKTYAMTGWRLGFAAAPARIVKAMSEIQIQLTSGANAISQWAGLAAVTGSQDIVEAMRQEYDQRRMYMVQGLNALPGIKCHVPEGAFYAFPDVSGRIGRTLAGRKIESAVDFCQALLEEAGVGFVPGEGFFQPGHVRISYACSLEQIKEGLKRVEKSLRASG